MPECVLKLAKQAFKFSAGHFTIFSETERERLHGHDWFVSCELVGEVGPDGLIEDYARFKRELQALCDRMDEVVLLPGTSPWLAIEELEGAIVATFAGERMVLPARDVQILPIPNVSLEALSALLLERLLVVLEPGPSLRSLSIQVEAGPGQSASSRWKA